MAKNSRISELKVDKALRFVEELSWLMKSYEGADVRVLADVLRREQKTLFDSEDVDDLNRLVKLDSYSESLVGILPKIFTNKKWFNSNSDIAEFSQGALGLRIPRWEKISKFEMIGHIVCRVSLQEKRDHSALVKILRNILSDEQKEKSVIEMRKDQMSWNDIIRKFG
jgi:hypothetical protein